MDLAKTEDDGWVTVHPQVQLPSPYRCSHGVSVSLPCVTCRAEFDAGEWDAPGVEALREVAKEPHTLATRAKAHERAERDDSWLTMNPYDGPLIPPFGKD